MPPLCMPERKHTQRQEVVGCVVTGRLWPEKSTDHTLHSKPVRFLFAFRSGFRMRCMSPRPLRLSIQDLTCERQPIIPRHALVSRNAMWSSPSHHLISIGDGGTPLIILPSAPTLVAHRPQSTPQPPSLHRSVHSYAAGQAGKRNSLSRRLDQQLSLLAQVQSQLNGQSNDSLDQQLNELINNARDIKQQLSSDDEEMILSMCLSHTPRS
jgi:hypothetical protein